MPVRPPAWEAARTAGGAAGAGGAADDSVIGAMLGEVVVPLANDGEEKVVVAKSHACNYDELRGQDVSGIHARLMC